MEFPITAKNLSDGSLVTPLTEQSTLRHQQVHAKSD